MSEKEEILKGLTIFVKSQTPEKLAEFLYNQDLAIEGLQKNNKSFAKSFSEIC